MKTLLAWFGTGNPASRYTWSPDVTLGSGWIICTLNPFSSQN